MYLSPPPAQPSGAARAAAGSDDVGKGWLDDDGDKGAQYHRWLCVSFPPDADLGRRLLALSSAALLADDVGRRLAVEWPRGSGGACGAGVQDLFAPSTLLLPRAPRRCATTTTVGAADALGSYAQQRRAHVVCWEICEGTDWYVAQQPTDAQKAAARARQTAWLARLAPVADVASQVDALEATIARRAAVSLHVPRRGADAHAPRLFSPLWALVKEVDAIVDGLVEGAAASTGLVRRQHRRVQPLILLVTDDPAIEARLAAGYGRDRLSTHARRAAPEESVGGGGGGAGGGAAAATAERQSLTAAQDGFVELALLSKGGCVVGSLDAPFSVAAAVMGGARHRVASRPRSDVVTVGVSRMLWGLKPMAEKADKLEEEAERADPKRWVPGKIAADMASEHHARQKAGRGQ